MDKSKVMLFVIIGLLVVLIGTVVGVTIFLIGMVGNGDQEGFTQPTPPLLEVQMGVMELEEIPLGEVMTTNLASGPDGRAGQVRAGVVVNVDGRGDEAEFNNFVLAFNARMGTARAVVIDVFSTTTFDDIRTLEGRGAAAEEIRLRLAETFETNLISQVHFSEWFVQNPR